MATTDVLRPISVRKVGGVTVVPSGTVSTVTSDNSDSTYVNLIEADAGNNWNVRVGSHTPAAGYQRHRIRGRVHIKCDVGTVDEDIDLGRGSSDWIQYDTITATSTFTDLSTAWYQDFNYGLDTTGALSDLNIGGGWWDDSSGGAANLLTAEAYVDIDCRQQPQFSPEVQDASGTDRSGGTVADTNQPTLYFGGVGLDGLPALDWTVTVKQGATTVFTQTGSGAAPTSVPVTTGLDDGAYTATFTVRSVIRSSDPFPAVEAIGFSVENTVPPPSPPLLTITPQDGGYLVQWSDPGGQPWDNDFVVAELWRDDCYGSSRIATVPNGLNGSYLDLAIPQLDPQPSGLDCEVSTPSCDLTYRVRYLGYVSTFVELPDTIPADMILGWPSTAASIPSGWTRVTGLDGVLPRGATSSAAPSATGGASTHSHTTPNHQHVIGGHSHSVGGSTGTSNASTTSARFNGASRPQADQPHSHTRPASTGANVGVFSGATSPGTNVVSNAPPTLNVIWIKSDGSQANYPVGCVGFATETVSGWVTHAASAGRYLQGAAAAGDGGATAGASTHSHSINSHTHTGITHDHSIGATSQSNPASSTEAGDGSSTPRWLPRHTHPMDVGSAGTGSTNSGTGGTTGTVNHEPPNRRLLVLQNTGGGTQTRIIGLYTGAIADLDPLLTWCDGDGGTPDMRTLFAREIGSDSVNSTGGSSSHTHSVPDHAHSMPGHTHTTNVLTSTTASYEAPSFGDLGPSPTTNHDHSSGNTASATPSVTSNGAGTSGSATNIPPYKEVHFVRLDGTISGGPLPVPELKISDYSSSTVPSTVYGDGLDRLSNFNESIALAATRSSSLPKLVADTAPLDGGLHTVASTPAGEDLTLQLAAVGQVAIDALEELLSSDALYWSPVGGTAGWFAPGGWSVTRPTAGVWAVSVVMIRQPWPSVPDPSEFL